MLEVKQLLLFYFLSISTSVVSKKFCIVYPTGEEERQSSPANQKFAHSTPV